MILARNQSGSGGSGLPVLELEIAGTAPPYEIICNDEQRAIVESAVSNKTPLVCSILFTEGGQTAGCILDTMYEGGIYILNGLLMNGLLAIQIVSDGEACWGKLKTT